MLPHPLKQRLVERPEPHLRIASGDHGSPITKIVPADPRGVLHRLLDQGQRHGIGERDQPAYPIIVEYIEQRILDDILPATDGSRLPGWRTIQRMST